MADIFISYKRDTDETFLDKPISKFVENLKIQFKLKTDIPLDTFFDTNSIKVGAEWDEFIGKKLIDSEYLIILFSVGYFNSENCLKELRAFLYPKRGLENKKSRILPIQIADIDILSIRDQENRKIYEQIKKLNIIDFSKEYMVNKYEHEAREKIDSIIDVIKKPIIEKKKHFQISNIKIFEKLDLLNFEKENYNSIKEKLVSTASKYSYPPVCVIYTGGNVGMIHDKNEFKHDRNDLIQGKINDIVKYFFKLEELETDIHFFEITPVDSSNATFDDWVNIAKLIEKIYNIYQGFVILQGANTMAYAASFLSFTFENLQKPIIFTGSENPLVDIDPDAELNVLRSVQIASPNSRKTAVVRRIPEVCIFYGDKLFRGNRATKYHAFNPSTGFLTLNSPEIGTFSNNRLNLTYDKFDNQLIEENNLSSLLSSKFLNENGLAIKIFILEIYPDMPIEDYVYMFKQVEKIDGLILRTYGTGNPPDKPDLLLKLIKELMSKGTIVVNTTQSPEGRVLIKLYENNAALFDLGVVNGGDMTREAAYTKLKWLLGTEPNLASVKTKMQKNIRGELKYSSFNFMYPDFSNKKDNYYYLTNPIDVDNDLKGQEIDHAIIRITKIKILEELKKDKAYGLKILYNPQQVHHTDIQKEGYDDSLLATYERIIGPNEHIFDKNMEVTFDFKQFFHSKQTSIKLGVFFDPPLKFEYETLGLYVYTKSK